jgi:glycerophosphoryl diester phosphodiesterase
MGVLGLLLGWLNALVLGLASPERGQAYLYLLAVLLLLNSAVYGGAAVFLLARLSTLGTLLYYRLGGAGELEEFESEAATPRPGARRRGWGVAAAALLLLVVATLFSVSNIERELAAMGRPVEVTAHRGASAEAPENTLASVRLAIENGADYAEVDFQEAGDGAVVLFHDENLKRVTGLDRRTWELTLPELKELDVGSHFDPAFKDERIPTLDEVLAVAKGRIRLNLELKPHGHERNFARSVVDSVRRAGFEQDLVITSNDQPILTEIRSLAPELRIGMLVAAAVGNLSELDVDFYSVQPMYATVSFIKRAHAEGRDVHVWTVNDQPAMSRLIDRGIDNLITDYPLRAIEVVRSRTRFDEFKAAMARLFRK